VEGDIMVELNAMSWKIGKVLHKMGIFLKNN
jgi:hypothetical protein